MIDKAIIDELKDKGYITNPFVTGENLEVADLFKYGYITRINNEELEGILGGKLNPGGSIGGDIENADPENGNVDEPTVNPVVDEPVVDPVVEDPTPVVEPEDEVVVDEGEEEE
jgi:hypothetical protein